MSEAQKVIKYVALALAISLIVGIILGIYNLVGVIGGIFFDNNISKGYDITEFADTANILSIDLKASKLVIKEGEELKVESNNKNVSTQQDNNKLAILEEKMNIWSGNKNSEVIVTIPKDRLFDKVYIENGAGTINIDKLNTKDLEFEFGAGKVEVKELNVINNTKIKSGAGEVTINSGNFTNLDLNAGVGKFTLNAILKGENKIDAGVGELNLKLLDSKENYSVYAEKGIGSIKVDGNDLSNKSTYGEGINKVNIKGGIGSINVNFS